MGARGQKPREECTHGHDLTKPDAVKIVPRTRNGVTYRERQCRACVQKRSREWWEKNRGRDREVA